jgi:hypothetical protein
MTAWTDFAMKVFREGKKTNKSYTYRQALKDAGIRKRKGEMGKNVSMSKSNKSTRKNRNKKGGNMYGPPLSPASYDGIDGAGITTGNGQSQTLTQALTATGGAKRRRRKTKRTRRY